MALISITINGKKYLVDQSVAERLSSASADMRSETGQDLDIIQSYRSAEEQAKLYADYQAGTGGRAAAPGTSFHQSGTAVDVKNWQAAEPYLRRYGLRNDLSDDKGHFSYGETAAKSKLEGAVDKIEAARKAGKSDTAIADSIAAKVPELAGAIMKARQNYGIDTKIKNDRDLINFIAVKYSGRMPTVASVPLSGTETQPAAAGKKSIFTPGAQQLGAGIKKGLGVLQTGFEKFAQWEPVAKRSEAVGKVVGAAAGVIAAPITVGLETTAEAMKTLTGGGAFSFGEVKKRSLPQIQEAIKLGQESGTAALPAAIVGSVGGGVLNTLLMAGMGVDGYDEFKQGLKEGDPVKITDGALKVATVLLAPTVKGIRSIYKGKLVNPDVVDQIKSEVKYLSGKKTTPEVKINKATEMYREVLSPSKSEVYRVEVLGGKDINDAYRLLATKGYKIDSTSDLKLDTEMARIQNQAEMSKTALRITPSLEKLPSKDFDLLQIGQIVKDRIKARTNLAAAEKKSMMADIDEFVGAELEMRYGPDWAKPTTPKTLNTVELDQFKKGMWNLAYSELRPTRHTMARQLGREAVQAIRGKYPASDLVEYEKLNKEYGLMATTQYLLRNAHGRPIKGGKLGKYLAEGTGAIIGELAPIPMIPGVKGYLGHKIAGKIKGWSSSPSRITGKAATMAAPGAVPPARPLPPSLLEKAVKRIKPGLSLEDVTQILRESKGLAAEDIMKKYPEINLKRDVPIKDVHGVKDVIPKGTALTPYELKGNKVLLQDGETYIVSKNQFQNIKGNSVVAEAKEFAPEFKEVKEVVKGKITGDQVAARMDDLVSLGKTPDEARRIAEEEFESESATKYEQYTLPGGQNYREILIEAPEKTIEGRGSLKVLEGEDGKFDIVDSGGSSHGTFESIEEAQQHKKQIDKSGNYYSSHLSEPNVLSWLRVNDRTYRSKKVTFIEEIQSDWAQEVRRKVDAPTHPLLKNWQELAIKRALKEAVDNGSKYLSWTTGKQQIDRYPGIKATEDIKKVRAGETWAHNLYDRQIKNIVEDLTGEKVKLIDLGLPSKIENTNWAFSDNYAEYITNNHPLAPLQANNHFEVGSQLFNLTNETIYSVVKILGKGKLEVKPAHLKTGATEVIDLNAAASKTVKQQAIEITPTIRALVKGEAPPIKKPSGREIITK